MEYRSLGRTGVKVSPLCLGCMTFGTPDGKGTPDDEAMNIIDKAIEAGINFLDTANVYSRGGSETLVGKALGRNGKRNHIVLATKVHGHMEDNNPNAWGNSRRHNLQQCDASLRRLQTDWIDLYQIHRPLSSIPIDETLRALDDLIRAGKIRYIGTSTYAAWQLVEALWIAKELGLNRFVCEQPPYHLLDRRIERELIPMAQTYGFGLIPWSPLAGGFLSGKYERGKTPTEGRWTGGQLAGRTFNDKAFEVIEALKPMAAEKKCTVSQLSLSWCMNQPAITSPIIGPRTMQQYEDNLGALNVTLSDDDRKKLDEIVPPGTHLLKYYDADFGPSKFQR